MRPERIPVYLDVRAEVVDLAAACFLQVIIYPTQQQLLGRKFHQILQTFSIAQQSNQSCSEKKQTSVFSATTLSFGTEELALGWVYAPSFLVSSMSAKSPILMTCQSRPRTRCCRPSFRSSAPMLTTWQPMADAEFSAKFRFSCNNARTHSQNNSTPGSFTVSSIKCT